MDEDRLLDELRQRIDSADAELQRLLNERARCALDIAALKQKAGIKSGVYRPEREAQVLERIVQRQQGQAMPSEEMVRLFREIMSTCRAIESPIRIAYLGPEGTFTQEAAHKQFGHSVHALPLAAIDEVFREVESDNVDFGIVPVENSTEGVVNHTLDMLLNSPLRICGEVVFRIHHYLMGRGENLKDVRRVVSHQQSIAQCREWLNANLPGIEIEMANSNAEAARQVRDDPQAAAIAGEAAATTYGLKVLAQNIEDHPENTTRFLVLGKLSTSPTGNDKTSLVLSGRNRPGALYQLLEPFSRHGISMSRIESRPSRTGLWEYAFFVDVEGHEQDENVAGVLRELEAQAIFLKRLGSYPRAVL